MSNSISYTKNYTSILDAVYQSASMSGCLTSGRRMARAGRNAKFDPASRYPQPRHSDGTARR